MNNIFDHINTKIENNDIKNALNDFNNTCYLLFYNKLMDGFIYSREDIIDTFHFFLNINDNDKVKKISEILNKYYKGALENIFNNFIKDENYEMCNKIKSYLNYH